MYKSILAWLGYPNGVELSRFCVRRIYQIGYSVVVPVIQAGDPRSAKWDGAKWDGLYVVRLKLGSEERRLIVGGGEI